MPRAAIAVLLLLVLTVGQLVDALLGGQVLSSPLLLLASVAAGYVVGLTVRAQVAAPAVVVSAVALTGGYQFADPGAYPVLDDLVFALLVVGAPALAGAAVRARAAQVRELDRLAARLAAQRRDEIRLARLEERNRVGMTLHRGFSEQVAAISMRAESALGADEAEARQALAEVEAAARQSLDELRDALGVLRESSDSAAPPGGGTVPAPTLPVAGEPAIAAADLVLGAGCGLLIAVEAVVSPQAQGPAVVNAAVGLLAGLPLVARRHRPVTACAATLAVLFVMALWLTPPTEMVTSILALLVCGYTAGAHAPAPWERVTALATVAVGVVAAAWASPPVTLEDDAIVPVTATIVLSFLVGTVTAGWNKRAAQRRAAVSELKRSAEVEIGLAVAEQRNRIAGELHDTVAHAMTVVCLQASAALVRPGTEPLETILSTARTSLAELRHGLDGLGETHELGVASVTAQARRAGLVPEVRCTGPLAEVPPQVRRVAARVVREAITNAGRYAPGSRVRIEVAVGGQLRLFVADEGAPEAVPAGVVIAGSGSGLPGLAAETERAGGTLTWGPHGSGFRVEATLPGAGVVV
jgi:signal transduction histidine kinase